MVVSVLFFAPQNHSGFVSLPRIRATQIFLFVWTTSFSRFSSSSSPLNFVFFMFCFSDFSFRRSRSVFLRSFPHLRNHHYYYIVLIRWAILDRRPHTLVLHILRQLDVRNVPENYCPMCARCFQFCVCVSFCNTQMNDEFLLLLLFIRFGCLCVHSFALL